MKTAKTVWGIDIGRGAIKALKVRDVEGEVQADALDIVELGGGDPREASLAALSEFARRTDLSDSHVVVSIPGTHARARSVHMPHVHNLDLPEVVRFEAGQQLPAGLDKVMWQWQTFHDLDDVHAADVELGIFAVDRADVGETLLLCAEAGVNVDIMQVAPLALHNFMKFDGQDAPAGATLLVDVGAENTDLVIAHERRIWIGTIASGGRRLTEALALHLDVSLDEAERRKLAAEDGRGTGEIVQAMQPVFAELGEEIQRTLDEYAARHRPGQFGKLLAVGNGFRARGLAESIETRLAIPLTRMDRLQKLGISPTLDARAVHTNISALAVAYGLGVQGLGRASVHANFLPPGIARRRDWASQGPHKALAWLKQVLPSLFE